MKLNYTYLLIFAFIGILFFTLFNFFRYVVPAEDAAIIFNYAENLRQTGSISYYPNGPVYEGYTDTLFMLVLYLFGNFSKNTFLISQLVSIASILLVIFFIFNSKKQKQVPALFFIAILLIFSPQMEAAWRGYGTWLFALTLAFSSWAFLQNNKWLFYVSLFVAFVARMESIVILAPLWIYHFKESTDKRQTSKEMLIGVFLPVFLYLVMKYFYFGSVFPGSFYITRNSSFDERIFGIFYVNSFFTNYHFLKFYVAVPLLIVFFIGLTTKSNPCRNQWMVTLSLTVMPLLVYMMFSQQMNLGFRYQIPIYLGLVYLYYFFFGNYRMPYAVLFSFVLLFFTLKASSKHVDKTLLSQFNKPFFIATEISKAGGNLKLLTTESGIYPWKIKGITIDAWGLNSPELRNRLLTIEDIERFNPDLVVANCNPNQEVEGSNKTWSNMCGVLNEYFICNKNYIMYRVPNSGYFKGYHLIWVKDNLTSKEEIVVVLEKYNSNKMECKN